jgi:hypothetical protein
MKFFDFISKKTKPIQERLRKPKQKELGIPMKKTNKKTKKEKIKSDIVSPKKKSPIVNALLYSLKVLWGAIKLVMLLVILVCFVGAGLGAGLIYGYIETCTKRLRSSDYKI